MIYYITLSTHLIEHKISDILLTIPTESVIQQNTMKIKTNEPSM